MHCIVIHGILNKLKLKLKTKEQEIICEIWCLYSSVWCCAVAWVSSSWCFKGLYCFYLDGLSSARRIAIKGVNVVM